MSLALLNIGPLKDVRYYVFEKMQTLLLHSLQNVA
jgi:hypothetical protein